MINFSFGTNGKLIILGVTNGKSIILGVPILKHITVYTIVLGSITNMAFLHGQTFESKLLDNTLYVKKLDKVNDRTLFQ